MSHPKRIAHHRVLGVAVPGLAGFERAGLTCVAVNGIEQAIDLVTLVEFDLLLIGGESVGPAVGQLTRWLRTTTTCPRWAVVSSDPAVEVRARAMGSVAVVSDVNDPRLIQLLESLHARSALA